MTERATSPAAEPYGTPPLDADPSASGATARRLATAELVLEIATAASGELGLDEILRAALDRLGRVIAFTGGSIALVEDDDLVIRAAVGPFAATAVGQHLRRGSGRSWRIVTTLECTRIDDTHVDGVRVTGQPEQGAIRSWLGVPIARGGAGIGVLEVDSTTVGAFDHADQDLLLTVAQALAGPIDLAARYAAEQRGRLLRDAFSGMISHELRTPITTIYGMSQVLRQRHATMSDEQRGQVIADIEAESDRLRRLAEDLLVLSRAEGGRLELDREPLVISHLLRRVATDEARRWPNHRFEVDAPVGLPIVVGEDLYVEQVVRNLLSNAAKYSDMGTAVLITATAADGVVEVRVLDEGIGIDPTVTEQVFDLYFRAPEATRQAAGAGIGLFVCRQLIESMGGRIWALPRDPSGTEFGFSLPLDPDA